MILPCGVNGGQLTSIQLVEGCSDPSGMVSLIFQSLVGDGYKAGLSWNYQPDCL